MRNIPRFLFLASITLYQYTLSPDHGVLSYFNAGVCRYRPTCSEYTKRAIIQRGVVQGVRLGFRQARKCH